MKCFDGISEAQNVHHPPLEDEKDRRPHHRRTRNFSPLPIAGCIPNRWVSQGLLLDSVALCTACAHSVMRFSDPDGCDRDGCGCAMRRWRGSVVRRSRNSPFLRWICVVWYVTSQEVESEPQRLQYNRDHNKAS